MQTLPALTALLAAVEEEGGKPGFSLWWIPIIIAAVVLLIIFLILGNFLGIWLQARMANAPVSFIYLLGMYLRKVDYRQVVRSYIALSTAGIPMELDDLQRHAINGGRVYLTASVLVKAKELGLDVAWAQAAALDLQGEEYLRAILPDGHRLFT